MNPVPSVGVIVPVLNEAATIDACVQELLNNHHQLSEIVIADGGSTDGTLDVLAGYASEEKVTLVRTGHGRGQQMNAGALCCNADILLFLHADTRLPVRAAEIIGKSITSGNEWGRFDVVLDDPRFVFRIIETLMNLRSCISGICTGDQAMYVRRDVFQLLGGFENIPLMEDIEISRRLCWFGNPACIHEKVTASARRWQRLGVLRTVGQMWWLRLLYWLGRSPQKLVRNYQEVR